MIFSKAPNPKNIKFTINSKIIENTKEFKYLGISINSKDCSFKPTLSDLSSKANKAIYSLLSKMPVKLIPVKTMLKLFNSCIAPILLWKWSMGSLHEFWLETLGYYTNWKDTQFLKRILGVNRSTTNVLVRSEVGRHSLQEKILTRNINYIKYIDSKDPQALVIQSANYEILHIDNRNSLYSILKKYEQNLINPTNDNEGIGKLSKPKLCKITKAEFDVLWKTQVNTFSKADTYKLFKNTVKFESYLTDIKNRKHRVTFTKYRLSDHCLMIEKGRHKRPLVPREERYCPFTPTVESEIHFLHSAVLIKTELDYSTS